MAKESGLGVDNVQVDDSGGTLRAIINDVTNLEFATPRGVQEVTGIDKSAIERLLLLADFSCTLNGVFNDAASTVRTRCSRRLQLHREPYRHPGGVRSDAGQ